MREAIIGMGGAPPEQLPTPATPIPQVRREETRRLRIEAEDRLGLFAQLSQVDAPDGDEDEADPNLGEG